MKLKVITIAALFAVSSFANAGGPTLDSYSIHKISNLKLKAKSDVDGDLEKDTIKGKDVIDVLCDPAPDKAELVVLVPCPIPESADGPAVITVWDKKANDGDGDFAESCGSSVCGWEATVFETNKDDELKRARGFIECDVGPADFIASIVADVDITKDDDTVASATCFKKVQSKSLLGDISDESGDAVIEKGTLKAGKRQGTSSEPYSLFD